MTTHGSDIIAHLTVKHPHGTDIYELSQQMYKVGRDKDCEIRVNHPTVSRIHCCLVRAYHMQPNRYLLVHGPLTERKKATNGVYVGGLGIPLVPDFNPEDVEAVEVGQAYSLSYGENVRLSPAVMLLYRDPQAIAHKVRADDYDSTLSE